MSGWALWQEATEPTVACQETSKGFPSDQMLSPKEHHGHLPLDELVLSNRVSSQVSWL